MIHQMGAMHVNFFANTSWRSKDISERKHRAAGGVGLKVRRITRVDKIHLLGMMYQNL